MTIFKGNITIIELRREVESSVCRRLPSEPPEIWISEKKIYICIQPIAFGV